VFSLLFYGLLLPQPAHVGRVIFQDRKEPLAARLQHNTTFYHVHCRIPASSSEKLTQAEAVLWACARDIKKLSAFHSRSRIAVMSIVHPSLNPQTHTHSARRRLDDEDVLHRFSLRCQYCSKKNGSWDKTRGNLDKQILLQVGMTIERALHQFQLPLCLGVMPSIEQSLTMRRLHTQHIPILLYSAAYPSHLLRQTILLHHLTWHYSLKHAAPFA